MNVALAIVFGGVLVVNVIFLALDIWRVWNYGARASMFNAGIDATLMQCHFLAANVRSADTSTEHRK